MEHGILFLNMFEIQQIKLQWIWDTHNSGYE
jgi:hypothetical protein